jgi:hypothetical protein
MPATKRFQITLLAVLLTLAASFVSMSPKQASGFDSTYEVVTDADGSKIIMAKPGSAAVIELSTGKLLNVIPPSSMNVNAITVTRGCTNKNAGCWTSGSALGNMQFAGSGAVSGTWPYRNAYYTGNLHGFVIYQYKGATMSSLKLGPHLWIRMANNSAVTGKSVTRW